MQIRILVEMGRCVRTPLTSETTAGWASGNWIAAARSGTPWRAQTAAEPAGALDDRRAAPAGS